jgi:hypothetical protein
MIIRRAERPRKDILSILVAVSALRKVKSLNVFEILKETTHRSMSSLLSASTMCQPGDVCAEETEAWGDYY